MVAPDAPAFHLHILYDRLVRNTPGKIPSEYEGVFYLYRYVPESFIGSKAG